MLQDVGTQAVDARRIVSMAFGLALNPKPPGSERLGVRSKGTLGDIDPLRTGASSD